MEEQTTPSETQSQKLWTVPKASDSDKRRLKSVIVSNTKEDKEMG